jgi:hypothetical protein
MEPNMVIDALYGSPGEPLRIAVHEPDKRRHT